MLCAGKWAATGDYHIWSECIFNPSASLCQIPALARQLRLWSGTEKEAEQLDGGQGFGVGEGGRENRTLALIGARGQPQEVSLLLRIMRGVVCLWLMAHRPVCTLFAQALLTGTKNVQ